MTVRRRLLISLAAAPSILLACHAAHAQLQFLEPATAFTARRIGYFNVATNVIAGHNSSVEGTPLKSHSLNIKEGTSDRTVLEFDVRGLAVTDVARLRIQLGNIDRPRSTPLYLYSFDGNGLANAVDFYRIDNFITTFTDNGVASPPTFTNSFTLDVTSAFNQAVSEGHEYLGLIIRNQVGGPEYARYLISDLFGPPRLVVGIPEPTTAALFCIGMGLIAWRLRSSGQESAQLTERIEETSQKQQESAQE